MAPSDRNDPVAAAATKDRHLHCRGISTNSALQTFSVIFGNYVMGRTSGQVKTAICTAEGSLQIALCNPSVSYSVIILWEGRAGK